MTKGGTTILKVRVQFCKQSEGKIAFDPRLQPICGVCETEYKYCTGSLDKRVNMTVAHYEFLYLVLLKAGRSMFPQFPAV